MKTAVLFVFGIVALVIAACGGGEATPRTPSPATSPVATLAPSPSPAMPSPAAASPSPAATAATTPVAGATVRVMVPTMDNLQFMSFWVAVGAGLFKEEGLDVQLVIPPMPQRAPQVLLQGQADVAVMAPPLYLNLISQQQPVVLFANLLANDQINLIVRKDLLDARNVSLTAPLAQRLQAIKGLKVGVAPGPVVRLRALLASVGMDADRDIEVVILAPEQQNQAFGDKQVDALYAHTPFLERAIVEQDAVILVNQSKGEVPQLSGRQIHSLVTTRSVLAAKPEMLASMTRAILRAQRLVHADQKAAVDAILRAGIPGLDRRLLETIVAIYEPAVPQTPAVSVEGIEIANRLFPESQTPPDLSKVNLADYIAPRFADEAARALG